MKSIAVMKKFIFLIYMVIQAMALYGQSNGVAEPKPYTPATHGGVQTLLHNNKDRLFDLYDITQYIIDISVSPFDTYIQGNTKIRAIVKALPLDTFLIQLIDEMTVDSVFFEKEKQDYIHTQDKIRIPLNTDIAKGESFTVTIYYRGNSTGSGVSTGHNKIYDKNVTWSLSEPFHAKEWFPCKQVLADKADSATIMLKTKKGYVAVSNGLLQHAEPVGDTAVKYYWVTHYPINYYLLSFAVSDYRQYNFYAGLHTGDSVFVQNFIYDDDDYLNKWEKDIDRTEELLALYSGKFGTYPFIREKYGHSLMERNGGMEHQTITTLSNFSFLLVAHELTHQWFGNYVTCASWQDIWINEGFASYGEYLALEYLEADNTPDEWMQQAHKYAMNAPRGSVYVPFEQIAEENRIFDFRLSYKKGAALIHMIRYFIDNDPLFFQILRSFLTRFQHDVATGEDFKQMLHAYTPLNFSNFFSQWYYGKGYPTYKVTWQNKNDSVYIDFKQTTSAEEPAYFTLPVELRLESSGFKDTVIVVQPAKDHETLSLYYPYTLENIIIDPDNWILNGPSGATQMDVPLASSGILKLYPNPAGDILNIDLQQLPHDALKKIIVKEITGSILYSSSFRKNQWKLKTGQFKAGIYLIEIHCNHQQYVEKFIKL
jgi:aminopeptidase N